jgi:hypothetical protein
MENVMRTLSGLSLAAALVLVGAAETRAQWVYAGSRPTYGGYAFKDEPLMSINRSYLGYSNFVDYGPESALGAYSGYNAAVRARAYPPAPVQAPTYVQAPAYVQTRTYAQAPTYYQAPARRGFRLFGWRRGYGY